MTALWIILGVAAFIVLATWRLRRAAAKVDRILTEEAEETQRSRVADDSETEALPASHDR
jgi:hypothetical protein